MEGLAKKYAKLSLFPPSDVLLVPPISQKTEGRGVRTMKPTGVRLPGQRATRTDLSGEHAGYPALGNTRATFLGNE